MDITCCTGSVNFESHCTDLHILCHLWSNSNELFQAAIQAADHGVAKPWQHCLFSCDIDSVG